MQNTRPGKCLVSLVWAYWPPIQLGISGNGVRFATDFAKGPFLGDARCRVGALSGKELKTGPPAAPPSSRPNGRFQSFLRLLDQGSFQVKTVIMLMLRDLISMSYLATWDTSACDRLFAKATLLLLPCQSSLPWKCQAKRWREEADEIQRG